MHPLLMASLMSVSADAAASGHGQGSAMERKKATGKSASIETATGLRSEEETEKKDGEDRV